MSPERSRIADGATTVIKGGFNIYMGIGSTEGFAPKLPTTLKA